MWGVEGVGGREGARGTTQVEDESVWGWVWRAEHPNEEDPGVSVCAGYVGRLVVWAL